MEEWDAAHAAAVRERREGYLDPATGFFVFTSETLRARGWCCGSGCRHCPYGDDDDPGRGESGSPGDPGASGREGVTPDR